MRDVKRQYPLFLLKLAESIASIAGGVADRARHVIEHPECISDRPNGSESYPHVCNLPDGTTITIRQFDRSKRHHGGHQLEIQRGKNGPRICIPKAEPIRFPDSDDELLPLASKLAPYVVAVLAGVNEVGELNPARGIADF